MKPWPVIGLMMLAGCAGHMPVEVIESGAKHEVRSALPSRQAANCIARNGQNVTDLYAAQLLELRDPETFEVVVNAPRYPQAGALVVVHTKPSGNGSAVTLYTSPRMPESTASEWVERLRAGC